MFARDLTLRKGIARVSARLFAFTALVWVAACDVAIPTSTAGTAPRIDPAAPVQVALLLPRGSADPGDAILARDLENAARLAMSDLQGATIDLRVYATGGGADQAASAAATAVNDGAQIILGPIRAVEANAAAVAVSGTGVNVLAFSNTTTIAGGNLFILGQTFRDTANRLARFGLQNGLTDYAVVHADDVPGALGRDAIASAVRASGGNVVTVQSYPLSQQGIQSSAPAISQAVLSSGADVVFYTGGLGADLPLIATALPQNGVDPGVVRAMGITRWDVAAEAMSLPGLQGGLFTVPDQQTVRVFEARYAQAYGGAPHPLAGLAYDGIAAIGALVAQGRTDALSAAALTQPQGFQGTAGIFRLLSDGTTERGLSVATIRSGSVVILAPAPRSFGGQGS